MLVVCVSSWAFSQEEARGLSKEEKAKLTGRSIQSLTKLGAPKTERPGHLVLEDGRYLLWGDLFKNGRTYAVVDEGEIVVIAEHTKKGWENRSALDVQSCWHPEGKDPDYPHLTPPKEPFKLKDLNGDNTPELIIAFNNDGYAIGYHIAKWSPREDAVKLLHVRCERGEPEWHSGFLVTYDGSKRKAWWGETLWYRWVNGRPVFAASWYDDCHNEDATWELFTTAKGESFKRVAGTITRAQLDPQSSHRVIKETPFAQVTFQWKEESMDAYGAEALYLFERLTGLPAEAYGGEINGTPVARAKAQQKNMTVEVTGTPEGIKRLK